MTNELKQDYTLRISQASGTEIIVILYELATLYLEEASSCYNNGDHEGFRNQCLNTQRVLIDLIGALDFNYELALPLYRIYEYISKEIGKAVAANNIDIFPKCIEFITSLKDSFEKIAKDDKTGPVMGNTQTVYAGLTYGKGTLNESTLNQSQNRGYSV